MNLNIKKYQKFRLSQPTFWKTSPNNRFKKISPIVCVEGVTKNDITLHAFRKLLRTPFG